MSRYRQTMTEALKQVYKEQDEKDHEISMARGELEAIADKATQLAGALQGKSDEGNPLEAWVQSKITKAKDYINSVSDYLMYNPDMKQNEETELEEGISVKAYKNAIDPSKKGLQINKTGGMSGTIFIKDKKELNDLMTKLTQATKLYNIKEELEEGFSSSLKQKAKEIAKKFANNMTKAVDEIEKLAKGLSDEPEVYKTIRQYNEEIEVDEKISDIFKANKEGESIDDIAKRLKLSTSMVKKLIGEDLNEQDEQETDPDKIALAKEKDTDVLEKQLKAAQGQINVLKQKIENEKNKAIRPEPNPETGEVPLTIGIAHKILRDNQKKEAEEKKQKENSDKLQQLNVEETRLEAFTRKFLSNLDESAASEKAKAMGLKHMSFGRYGKGGKVTHRSVGGALQKVGKGDTGTSDKPKSSSKETSKGKSTSKSFGKGGKSSITLGDLDGSDKDLQDLIKKSGLKMKSKEGEQGDDMTLSGNSKDIEKVLDTMYGDDWKDMYQNKGGEYVEKENSLENYKKSNAYEMLAGRAAILDADNITQTDFGLEKDFDRLRSTLKGYGDNETVSLMDKFKDAIEEDDSESYPELKQDLRYALETGDAKNNPVYDQLKKVDDATKIFGQQKYSSGDVKSYLKDTSVMINQLDKLFKMSISEPMTQQDTVRQVRNDSIQRIAQASEKMVDGLRNVAKGIKDVKQIRILANLENEIKDLQPEGGIYQNYALPKRVKDNIFLIKDYMKMYKRYEEGSTN